MDEPRYLSRTTQADPPHELETAAGVVDVEIFVNCRYCYDIRCEVVGATGTASLDPPGTGTVLRDGRHARPGPGAWDGYAATAVAESCVASLTDGRRTGVTLVDRPPLYP